MVSVAGTRARLSTFDWTNVSKAEFWLEAMWLSALGLIPILFSYNGSLVTFDESKSYALHFFALTTLVLLTWDLTSRFVSARQRGEKIETIDIGDWLKKDRANLLLGLIAVFTFIYAISTALSPMPFFSLWGLTPASGGYSLYSFVSMMVILLSIVMRMKTIAQVWRVMYVIAAIGSVTSIYGISQHFGWDPLRELSDANRVYSSFGNPIHFGAYLVISIPITAAIALRLPRSGRYRWLGVLAIAFVIQLIAMWFTGSRGPLAGLVGAGLAVVVGMVFLLPKRQLALAAGVVVVAMLVLVVTGVITGDVSEARSLQFSGQLTDLTNTDGSGRIDAGLGGRGEIWGDVLELAVSWDTLPEDEGLARGLRPLFGFGPDMLRFSSSLVSQPRISLQVVDHAHNRPLQVLAEQGWVGFIVFIGVIGLIGWLIFLTGLALFRNGRSNSALNVGFIAIFGAMTGVAVEQLTGVGRVSDLFTSWALVGVVVVLFRMSSVANLESEVVAEVRGSMKNVAGRSNNSTASAAPFIAGLIAAVLALVVFILVDAQMLVASRTAFGQTTAVDKTEVYQTFLRSRNAAPQIEYYTVFPVELLIEDARTFMAIEQPEDAARSARQAYALLLEYHERNPLAIRTRILLAETAALLLENRFFRNEEELRTFNDELILRYENLAQQFPNEGNVIAVVANAYVAAAGDMDEVNKLAMYEKSLATADYAIELEAQTRSIPQAWWVRGLALVRLDREDEAIEAFETSIERDKFSQFASLSHKDLAAIYLKRGETELAETHRIAAESN